jgi:autotransporter-associated beta strand protein
MPKIPKSTAVPSGKFPDAALRCLLVAVLAVLAPLARAEVIYGLTSDTDIREDGSISVANGSSLLLGGAGSPALDRSAIFVFQFPDFGAVANPFTSAKFQFNVSSKNGTPPNVDLYGLGRRASSTVLASDYYGETPAADPTDATFLQNNILISTTATGVTSTSTTGGTALVSYLNAQYAAGAGAGQYLFLRFSTKTAATGVNRYGLTSADGGSAGSPDTRPQIIFNLPSGYTRPFIWVRDSEKAGILARISGNAWATSVYNGMVARVAADLASHQADRDTFLRQLPIVDWAAATPKFKTIPAYAESTVRFPAEAKFNDALDCAVLYYLTGDAGYARCAGDILHNAVKTLLPVAASTSTGNGGWIFQSDLLKEARVTGNQLPIVYDFLYSWLQGNQVYDVKTAGMVNFNFTNAQSVFRKYYQLTRDHGQKDSNWSALMATTMLNNLLALDDSAERATALQVYLTTGTSRQASLQYDYRHYTEEGDIWPESLQYAGAVGSIRSTHMVLLERVDPSLNLFDAYPNLPLSLPRISYLRYPNGEQIMFGDGGRAGTDGPFFQYELVYQHALARGRTDLTSFFGSLINGAVADGNYNRSTLKNYSTLGTQTEPLQLLWQAASLAEPAVTPELPRTDRLPFAGIALQRNPSPAGSSTYGLMGFVGGAAHVHSHASGMSMELFGMDEVMGSKSGTESYGSTINENYYRVFASNNTVVVNGASRGEGGWGGFGINTVQTVAMEPQPFANAVSPDFSFTCSSFADDKGTLAEGTQQRTLAIVRSSPTTGFYVDLFRSKSTVTNRTATTLDGPVTNQYHDYIYRNIGETAVDLRADGVTLPLVGQANRFQNDIGDANDQPGWRYFTNTVVSYPTSASVRAQFVATVSGTPRYMDMHMPAVASREYAKVDSPAILDAPSPYHSRVAPTLVVRQIGEAWNKAFATVYEPHFGSTGGTVQNVSQLLRGGIVVGVKVESTVGLKNTVHYILSNPAAGETFTDAVAGLSFTGRFGIAADNGDGTTTLYLGEGSSMAYRGNSVATVSGAASQAEVRFTPGQPPVVTSNTAVNVVSAPPPPGFTWVPTTGGTGYDWTHPANWNPASVPNTVGGIAYKNINITGDQTVNVNTPVTLGEIVAGDSSGAENTLLQKGTNGSLVLDQTENATAYLTRTAGGTGSVTFNNDLNITLNDNLTVRLAGGSASSTMVIAGILSGSGKSLSKEGGSLTLSLAGANTYSGATRIQGGILSLDQSLALQNSVLDTVNSITGDATNGLRTTVTSLTFGGLTGSKSLASVFTSTAGGYSGVTALTLNPGTGATLDYSGVIANGAAGMTLAKTGPGTQILSGVNTYTGATAISANSGTLQIGGAGTLGNGSYGGSIAIGSSSVFEYSSSAAQTLSGAISGAGALVKNTSNSTLTLGGSNLSFTGSVTLTSGTLTLGNTHALSAASTLTMSGTTTLKTSVQNATLNAPITVSGTPTLHAPDFGTGSTVSTLTLNGGIAGPGDVTFSSNSTVASNSQQTIRLNAPSAYAGSTTLNPADNDANLIVKLGIANALPTTTVLSINGVAGGGSGRSTKLDLNGFNQTVAGLQNTAANLRSQQVLNSGAAATLTIQNTTDHAFSGVLNGTNLSLAKTGPGTQTIGGVNTMTGTTTINQGRLLGLVDGSSASSTVILDNPLATFGVSITDNTKTWTCAALATTAAGTLEFNFGPILPGAVSPLTVTGLAAFTSSPAVRVLVDSGLAPGSYPLMTWGSKSGTVPSLVSVLNPSGTGGLADGTSASLTVTGNTLQLVIISVPLATKANNTHNLNLGTSWTGGVAPDPSSTAVWNSTVTTANTTMLGADTTWAGITIENPTGTVTINAGNTLTLGANENDINMSSATANLTLNCPLILGDANIWNVTTGRTLTLGGIVSGSFPVTKQGLGTTILTGDNSYNGGTTLSNHSGAVEIGGAGKLGNGAYAGTIEIGSGSTFRYNSSAAQTLNGAISGAGTLAKSASSTLTLGAANPSFTGAVAINAGTLSLGNAGALGAASAISIAGGSTLTSQTTGISVTVPITLGAAATTATISFGRNTSAQGSFTLHEMISGDGNLTLTTPNVNSGGSLQTIFLGSANSYLGNTLITTGNSNNTLTVKATSADVLPATTVLTLTGGNGSGSGRTVTFDLNGFDQTLAGLTNSISTLTARNQRINNTSPDRATLIINNSADFTFGGAGISSTFNGNPVNPTAQIVGNLELNKMGPGKFTLAAGAGNTFNGATTIIEGILSLGHATSMQNSPLDTLGSVAGDAANGLQTTVTTLTLGGLLGDKNLASVFTTTAGAYANLTALTLNPGTGAICDYSGIIADGAAGMTLTKTGLGTQILSGSNTYSGATLISAGTLALGANDVLPTTTVAIGEATLDAATFTDTVGSLDLTGAATIHLDIDGKLAFADSSAIDWSDDVPDGGTLTLTGTFVSGSSLRFGTTSAGLTAAQLARISATGFINFGLDADGYLTARLATAYDTWAAANAGGQDANLDYDNDGVANGIEYIVGGTSTTHDLAKLPAATTADGNLIFNFIRDQASIDETTDVTIELGENLSDWPQSYPVPATAASNNPGLAVVKDAPVAGKDTVTLTLPLVPGGISFARLKVTP